MKIIDSHFHSLSFIDEADVLNNIAGGIDIGTEFNDLEERIPLIKKYPHILTSAAMGPWETKSSCSEELNRRFDILVNNIDKYKPDFLGEFGLDNYCSYGPAQLQEELMLKHMELAKERGMKVIIHNREADSQMVRILKQYESVNGVIHCFSGNIQVLETALDLGYYISYAGNVTFKNNESLRMTLKLVPSNRLLLETDSPYLTPVPLRGQKNNPGNIIHTYNCVAEYLGKSTEQLADEIYENFTCFCLHQS